MSLSVRLLISSLLLAAVLWWVGIEQVLACFATLDPSGYALDSRDPNI